MLAYLRSLLAPPLFDNEEQTRVSYLMTLFSWIAIAILASIVLFRLAFLRTGITIHTVTFASMIVLLLLMQYLVRSGHVHGASAFVTLGIWGMLTFEAWYSDGLRDLSVTAYIVIIMFASLLLGWRFAIFIGLLSISSIWYFSLMEYQGLRPFSIDNPVNYAFDLTSIFALVCVLIYLLVTGWTRTLQSARLELNERLRAEEKAQNELNERRVVESALRASEEKFRKVFHTSELAICIASLVEGEFIDANGAFWKLTSLEPESALGHTALELGMWNSPQERAQFVEDLTTNGSLKNVAVTFRNRGGGTRNTIAFYELIELKERKCVLAMFYDVTEQKQVENALKDAEARTRALLTAVPDMIFEISRDGTFTGFIPSSESTPLMPPEQFLGKNIRELFPPEIAEQTMFALERALESNQLHAFEYGMPPGEEVQFFEARVSAISSELAMIMVRDISQRKWIETERETLIKELEDKNAELERFTYTVSHDLKSPLITIKGFLGFLEQDAGSGNLTRFKADTKRIADAADKMQMLLNELLELSRVGRILNKYEQIPFEEVAREAVELVQGRLLSAHTKVEIQKNMPVIYGDRRRLVEVLQNLVDNAAKFVGNQPKPRIQIGQDGQEDGNPIFYVRDNGVGIAAEHQDRIFGLFNKLDTDTEGTGIGLTLVKRIVEVHGGRIWLQSAAGKGSTFFFTLQKEPEA